MNPLYKSEIISEIEILVTYLPGTPDFQIRRYKKINDNVYDVTLRHGTFGNVVCMGMATTGQVLYVFDDSRFIQVIRRELKYWAYKKKKELQK